MQVNISTVDEMKLGQVVKRDIDRDSGEITVYTETTVTLKIKDISQDDYDSLKDLMGCLSKSAAIGSRQGRMELFPSKAV